MDDSTTAPSGIPKHGFVPTPAEIKFIDELAQCLEEEALALFAGAGFTIDAGFPSWASLLRQTALDPSCSPLTLFSGYLEGDLAEIAQFYANIWGANSLKDNIARAIRKIGIQDGKLLETVKKLNFKTIWTTNYDEVIEKKLVNKKSDIDIYYREEQLIRISDAGKTKLYKVHGDINDSQSIVITKSELDREKELMMTFLKRDLVAYNFLFLGYSFSDQLILKQLGDIRVLLGNAMRKHYAIIYEPSVAIKGGQAARDAGRAASEAGRAACEAGQAADEAGQTVIQANQNPSAEGGGADQGNGDRTNERDMSHAEVTMQTVCNAAEKAGSAAIKAWDAANKAWNAAKKAGASSPFTENALRAYSMCKAHDLFVRYYIEALYVDDATRIPKILECVWKKVKAKHVFISGSLRDPSDQESARVDAFCASLVSELLASNLNLKIYCGMGNEVGRHLASGALFSKAIEGDPDKFRKRFIMLPFASQLGAEKLKSHREAMLSMCDFAIFIYGKGKRANSSNGQDQNAQPEPISRGMREEFEVAKEKGVHIIPIRHEGYESGKIYDEIAQILSGTEGQNENYAYLRAHIEKLKPSINSKCSEAQSSAGGIGGDEQEAARKEEDDRRRNESVRLARTVIDIISEVLKSNSVGNK